MATANVVETRTVPLLDLVAQHRQIREEMMAEITRVVDSQKFILGDDVKLLEKEIAAYSQAKFGIGCASGSDALYLALAAGEIGPGDEVITTPYTFFATVGAICRTGATPVFVDVEPDTFNMDMEQLAAVAARRPKARAVIPIHLFGACADMDGLNKALGGRRSEMLVIEDAAQSIGSEYKGRRAGSIGDFGCLSFFPSKNLGGYGDGGMLTTNSPELAERLMALRVHGSRKKYYHDWVGVNSRLDALQAAVLRVKFRYLDGWSAGREQNAAAYRKLLAGGPVALPPVRGYQTRHVYNQFVICGERRDALQNHLKQQGIGTEVYYPLPLHLQKCFEHLGYKQGDFPVSERLATESLALPIYSELAKDDIEYVCEAIRTFYR
jgi:dTDP-4-amino-4,6-dideoxygalactose transaminase